MGFRNPPGPELLLANNQAGAAYALVLADALKVVRMSNAGANTVTIPANVTVAFPVGTVIEIYQYGTGQTTIAGAGGVTVRGPGGALKIAAQYGTCTLTKIAADEWTVEGRLAV